jgi:peptidoglycan/xylan/chitin deacetylase (PgdA/CDA1 family)
MFRFPFLSEGNTLPKRDAVRKYLADNRYVIAPVTLDYQDWLWTPPYERCRAKRDASAVGALKTSYLKAAGNALSLARRSSQLAFGRGIPQILLVHLNAFTATQLDQVLTEYEARGAKWVTLGEALKDPAYRVDPATAWPNGKDFLSSVIEARELSYPAHVPPPATELEMTCR